MDGSACTVNVMIMPVSTIETPMIPLTTNVIIKNISPGACALLGDTDTIHYSPPSIDSVYGVVCIVAAHRIIGVPLYEDTRIACTQTMRRAGVCEPDIEAIMQAELSDKCPENTICYFVSYNETLFWGPNSTCRSKGVKRPCVPPVVRARPMRKPTRAPRRVRFV